MKDNELVTPPGVLAHTHLKFPDTKGKYADDKFKTTIILDPAHPAYEAFASKLTEMCHAAVREEFPKLKDLSDVRLPFIDGNKKKDKETGEVLEEYAGKICITAKSKFQPGMVDAKRQPLPEDVFPYRGDLAKLHLAVAVYGESAAKAGTTVYLQNVMLLEKRGGRTGAAEADWGDDAEDYDGIDASKYQPSKSREDDDADDDADDGADF